MLEIKFIFKMATAPLIFKISNLLKEKEENNLPKLNIILWCYQEDMSWLTSIPFKKVFLKIDDYNINDSKHL